ncbi:MAG: hypothetical protein M0Q48_02450 [Verrucomicrobia bacterium]|nr:hypothetical protein [Verrucomicrobiota bacterium]
MYKNILLNLNYLSVLLVICMLLSACGGDAAKLENPEKLSVKELLTYLNENDILDVQHQNGTLLLERAVPGSLKFEIHKICMDELRSRGTNAYPQIITELNSLHYGETPSQEEEKRIRTLANVFILFRTNMSPFIPELESNLESNKNYIASTAGFAAMGQEGIPYLLKGMTNHFGPVRGYSARSLTIIEESLSKEEIARLSEEVIPAFLSLLKDEYDMARKFALDGLYVFCTEEEAEECINKLLECEAIEPVFYFRYNILAVTAYLSKSFNIKTNDVIDILKTRLENSDIELEKKLLTKVLDRNFKASMDESVTSNQSDSTKKTDAENGNNVVTPKAKAEVQSE